MLESLLTEKNKNSKNTYCDIFEKGIMELFKSQAYVFDLSIQNKEAENLNWENCNELLKYTKRKFKENNAKVGISKYAEKRVISRAKYKEIHLGIDLSVPCNTKIFCPLDGFIYKILSCSQKGYGNAIILIHDFGFKFYSFYGHLNGNASKLRVGDFVRAGDYFAKIGDPSCNGNWPPHLHLQLMHKVNPSSNDVICTCDLDKADLYLKNCPNPALIFNEPYREIFFKASSL